MPRHTHTRNNDQTVIPWVTKDGETFDTEEKYRKYLQKINNHDADVATGSAVNVEQTRKEGQNVGLWLPKDGICKTSADFRLREQIIMRGRMSNLPVFLHDAHVATGSAVNVDPVACKEESHEQRETEEDDVLLSMTQTSNKGKQKLKDSKHNPTPKEYPCRVCLLTFTSKEKRREHKRYQHPKEKSDEQETEEDDFHLSTTMGTRKNEFLASDAKLFPEFLHQKLNLPASSHDAGVATDSSVNVDKEDSFLLSTRQTSKPVRISHEEERFLMDVQFGSIDCNTFRLPVSSQETEEDSLSTTSTIDYDNYYTDEEYPAETEDDKDDERPTVEEVKKVTSYLESQLGLSYHESRDGWPDKDEWVASWKEVPPLSRWTWVNVFAYFNKKKGYGGYGIILRNAVAKPIIASANFSKDGKSFFYQVFMGIKASVNLADKYKRSRLNICCNSIMVPALFRDAPSCSDTKCSEACNSDYICNRCERYFSGYMGWNKKLMGSLVVELRGKIRSKKIEALKHAWSEPAHYIAKREKKNRKPKDEEKVVFHYDKPGDMELDDFPGELKFLLWRDAFASSRFMAMEVLDRGPYE